MAVESGREEDLTRNKPPVWPARVLIAAGIYNLVWGTGVVLFPHFVFRMFDMPPPRYPEIWQCVGMIVGVYGVGYLLASRNPMVHWPITLVGLLGKLFGPFGFFIGYFSASSNLPWQWIWILVTNDLIWWFPFAAILYQAFRYHAHPDRRREQLATTHAPRDHFGAVPEQNSTDQWARLLDTFPASTGQTLRGLSEHQPCLVLFLRHFGCTFSREAAAQLALNRGAFEARHVKLAVVHMGSTAEGAEFLAHYMLDDLPHISDPDCRLYRAFGLRRGTWRQLFGVRVWLRGFFVALLQRHGVGLMRGDGFQLSGVFVLEQGRIVDSYRSRLASDLPNLLQFTSAALECARSQG